MLGRALTALPPGSPTWTLGEAGRGVLLASRGDWQDIDPVTNRAIEAARALGDPDLLIRVVHLRLVAMRGPDFIADRAHTARRLLSLPGLTPALRLIADLHLVSHHAETGDIGTAKKCSAELEKRAEALRDPTLLRQTHDVQVALAMFEGRYEQAAAHLAGVVASTPLASQRYFQAAEAGVHAQMAYEQDALAGLAAVHRAGLCPDRDGRLRLRAGNGARRDRPGTRQVAPAADTGTSARLCLGQRHRGAHTPGRPPQ